MRVASVVSCAMRYESGSPHRDHHHQVVVWVVAVLRMAGFIGGVTVRRAAPSVNQPPSGNQNHIPDLRDKEVETRLPTHPSIPRLMRRPLSAICLAVGPSLTPLHAQADYEPKFLARQGEAAAMGSSANLCNGTMSRAYSGAPLFHRSWKSQ